MFSRFSYPFAATDEAKVSMNFPSWSSSSEVGISERLMHASFNSPGGATPTSTFGRQGSLGPDQFNNITRGIPQEQQQHQQQQQWDQHQQQQLQGPPSQPMLAPLQLPSNGNMGTPATHPFLDQPNMYMHHGLHLSRGASPSTPSRGPSRGASPPARMPNDILITADTDDVNAASMLAYCMSQGSTSHCIMHVQSDHPSTNSDTNPTQQLQLSNVAARTALQAALLANDTLQSSDLALVPFLSQEGSVKLLTITASLPAAIWQTQGTLLAVEPTGNPLMLALDISGTLGQSMQVDLLLEPQDTLLLLQATAVARINLQGSGQDLLMLPVPPVAAAEAMGRERRGVSLVKLVPATHVLSAKQLQQMTGWMQQSDGNGRPRVGSQPGLMQPQAASSSQEQQQQSAAYAAAAAAAAASMARDGYNMPGAAAAVAAAAAAAVASMSQQQMGPGGLLTVPASPTQQLGRQQQQQQRVRKADYVIVTEDTAIKNAAGAIAKVLGRVCDQGLCCPVYTEQKTGHPAGVVSAAVKAIAVARGYVVNEGAAHQVAFQPYLRHQSHAGAPPGGSAGVFQRHSAGTALPEQPAGVPGLDARLFQRNSVGTYMPEHPPQPSPRLSDQLQLQMGQGRSGPALIRSAENVQLDPSNPALADDRSELAFDVFKVPADLLPAALEDSSLPVKVTAHSRANVVSNIITKLVTERGSAVLITAGGRAMHVAMMAVVAARARLRATRTAPDVVLLPKFVTVDTTDTLGWESVFLKFYIVKAGPSFSVAGAPEPKP